jgi:putative polyhydroxyalkanoate system protein
MSRIHIKHHHCLEHHETHQRVERIARHLKKKYRVDYAWKGNHIHSSHKGSSVDIHLGDGCIEMKIRLGLLFVPLKHKIERAIRKNLQSTIGDRKGAPAKITLHEKL